MKKRESNAHYTDEENERLVSLLEVNLPMLETIDGRYGSTAAESKAKMWKNMELEFNKDRESRPYRNVKCLKSKYYYFKNQALHYKGDSNPLLVKVRNIFKHLKQHEFTSEHNLGVEDCNGTDNNNFFENGDSPNQVSEHTTETLSDAEPRECDNAETPSQLLLEVKYPEYESDIAEPETPTHMEDKNSHYECDMAEPEYQTQHMENKSFNYESDNIGHFNKRKPVQERAFEKLIGEKIQVVTMQKELVEDEIKEKKLKMSLIKKEHLMKKQIQKLEIEKLQCNLMLLKQELQHKQEMYQLEREEAQLRKDVLKRKLLFFQETEEC